ncbi:FmdB family zinc ribbon protein [Anaeromyxobacter diazotrophicus]|uniref:Regulatory protein n=1 Tax=Anaeromyxobacter diazotrophicus TaxID=2590199 RepID=A0A7I9VPF6_9BACT|nr:FmdB family zinc ribbon protein [Anaeromyxobacter diazotrophicus]GEJ57837.1 regulatory protein [Anaeromyxobacter diazotrophicus]
MPVYEFYCRRCEQPFTAEMHVAEHEASVVECPECHRKEDVEKRLSTFTAVTSHKSAHL